MISPIRFKLKPEWLAPLSHLASVPMGALCIWHGLEALPLPEEARQNLIGEGLLASSGAVTPGFLSVLNLLAAPSSSLKLELSHPDPAIDYRVFFSGMDDESVSLMPTGAELELSAPARPNDLLTSLRQHTGESLLQPLAFTADLPLTDALALAALMDRRRRNGLQAITAGSGLESATLTPAQVADRVANEASKPQWLTAVIRTASGLPTPPDLDHVAAALIRLASHGLVETDPAGESYRPAGSSRELADRLLLIQAQIDLTVCRANPQGDIHQARFVFLQSGVTNLLRIEILAGLVRLASVSAATLLDQVEFYLTHPNALPAPPPRPLDWKLGLLRGSSVSREYELTGPLKIGRGSDCEIQIADPRSSRHHAIIRLVEGGFELQDLGSTNGTYLNHIQILSPVGLQDGDLIRIGETDLKVMGGSSTAATTPTARPQPVQTPAPPQGQQEPAEPQSLAELPNQEAEPSDVELPAWLHNPPGDVLQAPNEELESENELETSAPDAEPEPEPLAWLHHAEQAQELTEPPAPDELLAAPPADLAGTPLEPVSENPPPEPPGTEEPILGETHPVEASSSAGTEPAEEPLEKPILGETRQVTSGRSQTEQICSQCGNSNPLTARFCGVCGNQLHD